MTVAREEFPDPQGPGAMLRAHQHDIAEAMGNQFQPTKDERPHDDLAELGVGLYQRPQVFPVRFQPDDLPFDLPVALPVLLEEAVPLLRLGPGLSSNPHTITFITTSMDIWRVASRHSTLCSGFIIATSTAFGTNGSFWEAVAKTRQLTRTG